MATRFTDIYERAIFKFTDYNFTFGYSDELKSAALLQYLKAAIVDFTHSCQADLKRYGVVEHPRAIAPVPQEPGAGIGDSGETEGEDEGGGEILAEYEPSEAVTPQDAEPEYAFDEDLDGEIIEILALGIVYHWLSAKAMNSELLRNIMHNSDYRSYSPANLLKEVRELRTVVKREYEGRIRTYSFRNSDIDKLKAGG